MKRLEEEFHLRVVHIAEKGLAFEGSFGDDGGLRFETVRER